MGGGMNSKASQSWQEHLLHLTNRLPQRRPPLYSVFSYGGRRVGWGSREKRFWVGKDVHDKLSSIFERSETDCSQPVMMPISNSSRERPNPSSVGSLILSPLGNLRLEIPVGGGLPGRYKRDLDTLLPSNTIWTGFGIYVAIISSHPERTGFRVREIDQMTSKCPF